MAIVINGSGTVTGLAVGGLPDGTVDSGTIATGTIVDADVANIAASKLTGALPAISGASLTGLTSAQMPTGSVLQVKQHFYTGAASGTSNSFDDTGLSVTITPSSTSSKILVMMTASVTAYEGTWQLRFLRGNAAIGYGGLASSRTQSTVGGFHPTNDENHQSNSTSAQYLDSPNTTSATTYKLQYKVQGNSTMYINRSGNDADNSDWSHRSTSSITVMEIAG